jgi:peptidoglycan/xylan/chitin deacetylase (PgdA/CDA1 family)
MAAANRIPVLMYHRIGTVENDWEGKYAITPGRFAEHMHILARHGFYACSADELVAWLQGEKTLNEGAMAITFDDGYAGVLEHGLPVLKGLGWPATMFLISDLIGGQDEWCRASNPAGRTYPLLTVSQITAMVQHGFSFYSHSRRHARLPEQSDIQLDDELAGSRVELETLLGRHVPYIAYPYGLHDERVLERTRSAGYQAAFSVQPGFNRPGMDLFRIRRLDVFGTDTAAMLLRKVRLGSNDGSRMNVVRYYLGQLFARFGLKVGA